MALHFSPAVVRELRAELDRIEARARAIRQILSSEPADLDSGRIDTYDADLPFFKKPADKPTHLDITNASNRLVLDPPKPATFKAGVVFILKEAPGIEVPNITKVLRSRGWTPNGHTDLGRRVYNEVWRMAKRGEVRKTSTGGWALIEQPSLEESKAV